MKRFAYVLAAIATWGATVALRAQEAQDSGPGGLGEALRLTARIPLADVRGRMDHLGVDVAGQRLFAAAVDNHTLEVIDLKSSARVRTLAGLDGPQGVFYHAPTGRLYVASSGDGMVRIFDGTTYAPLATARLASDADNIRFDVHSGLIVVGYGGEKFLGGKPVRGQGDGALAFLDASGAKVREIPAGGHPESFQFETSGTRVFVNVPDRHEIEVADAVRGIVLAHWGVTNCADNFPMALDEGHHRLFVACRGPARLLVFDTETGKEVISLQTGSSDDLFYDARKHRIYVISRSGFIDVFNQEDADRYGKLAAYPIPQGSGTGLFVSDWGKLFVSARRQGDESAAILVYETGG